MLPAPHRLRASTDFTEVVRRGRRCGRPTLTAHLLLADVQTEVQTGVQTEVQTGVETQSRTAGPARAGLVVSKAVGGSVVRHRVARRLRHQLAARLADLPAGSRLVVRAAPAAAAAGSDALGADLDAALARLVRR